MLENTLILFATLAAPPTAAEIQASLRPGEIYIYRLEAAGGGPRQLRRVEVVSVSEQHCRLRDTIETDGKAGTPFERDVPWAELAAVPPGTQPICTTQPLDWSKATARGYRVPMGGLTSVVYYVDALPLPVKRLFKAGKKALRSEVLVKYVGPADLSAPSRPAAASSPAYSFSLVRRKGGAALRVEASPRGESPLFVLHFSLVVPEAHGAEDLNEGVTYSDPTVVALPKIASGVSIPLHLPEQPRIIVLSAPSLADAKTVFAEIETACPMVGSFNHDPSGKSCFCGVRQLEVCEVVAPPEEAFDLCE